MSTTMTILQALGLYAAGKVSAPAVLVGSILYGIDSDEGKEALESVRNANKLPGVRSPVFALPYKPFQPKSVLEKAVEIGGTAWIQVGANRRLGSYWHYSKSFSPKESKDCPLGHVVHGQKDAEDRK